MSYSRARGMHPEMAEILTNAGVDVWIGPGFESRTTRSYGFYINGIVEHHTASSPKTSDTAVYALLREGRRDLGGPLSQWGVERDGTWVGVAAGRANHNGYGTWGNDAIGIEIYNNGVGEPYPDVQYQSVVAGTRALRDAYGLDNDSEIKGHKESDPGRKIDPSFDMHQFRRDVDTGLIVPVPPTPIEEDDMPLHFMFIQFSRAGEWPEARGILIKTDFTTDGTEQVFTNGHADQIARRQKTADANGHAVWEREVGAAPEDPGVSPNWIYELLTDNGKRPELLANWLVVDANGQTRTLFGTKPQGWRIPGFTVPFPVTSSP